VRWLRRIKPYLTLRNLRLSIRVLILATVAALAFDAIFNRLNPIPDKLSREQQNTKNKIVNDVTEINPIRVVDIVTPHGVEEISALVKKYDHISIGGGRNSMGGQTASERAVQIDLREYNKILNFLPEKF